MQRVGLLFVFALVFKTLVALAHAVVGDQGVDVQVSELFEVGLRVIPGVGGDEAGRAEERLFVVHCALDRLDDGHQQFLFAAGAVGLGIDDDLVFGVDGGDAGVALHHAFGCRHLGRLVVGAVALPDGALATFAVFGMIGKPLAELGGVTLQAGDALGCFLSKVGLDGLAVGFAVAVEHDAGSGFEFGGLMLEVGASAALLLAGVGRQFDAVDGEHLAPDQALPVAQVEHLGEDAGDVVGEGGDESGKGGEVRLAVARQGDEGNVVAADGFNVAAGNDALAVGEQNNLEQHGGWIGGSAGGVILEPGIEAGQIDLVIDEVVEGVLEGAGKQLPLEINRQKSRAGVDGFVARHAVGLYARSMARC